MNEGHASVSLASDEKVSQLALKPTLLVALKTATGLYCEPPSISEVLSTGVIWTILQR